MGNMGANHARRILKGEVPRLEVAAVCDRSQEKLDAFPDITQFTDSGEMIRSGAVDAVLIATPHYSHTTIGADALENGLHVLVEKPISVHKADCERLISAYQGNGQIFSAMFNQRTDPTYRKVRELIRSGELGQVLRFNWTVTDWFRTQAYYDSGDWRATWGGEGGGVLLNQCPHNLDLLQWMFGMPSKVRAQCSIGRYHEIEVEDDVTAFLQYENGCTGLFVTSTGEAPGINRLEIAGDRGLLVVEKGSLRFLRNEVPAMEFCQTSKQNFAKPPTWDIEIPVAGKAEQHIGIMKNFTAAILDGADLLAPAPEGVHSVELANAMLLSSFEERTIEVPLDAAHYEAVLKKKIAESKFVKKQPSESANADDFAQSFA